MGTFILVIVVIVCLYFLFARVTCSRCGKSYRVFGAEPLVMIDNKAVCSHCTSTPARTVRNSPSRSNPVPVRTVSGSTEDKVPELTEEDIERALWKKQAAEMDKPVESRRFKDVNDLSDGEIQELLGDIVKTKKVDRYYELLQQVRDAKLTQEERLRACWKSLPLLGPMVAEMTDKSGEFPISSIPAIEWAMRRYRDSGDINRLLKIKTFVDPFAQLAPWTSDINDAIATVKLRQVEAELIALVGAPEPDKKKIFETVKAFKAFCSENGNWKQPVDLAKALLKTPINKDYIWGLLMDAKFMAMSAGETEFSSIFELQGKVRKMEGAYYDAAMYFLQSYAAKQKEGVKKEIASCLKKAGFDKDPVVLSAELIQVFTTKRPDEALNYYKSLRERKDPDDPEPEY